MITNHPPNKTVLEIDDSVFSVLADLADVGVLGSSVEQVVNHILRTWIWDNQCTLEELEIDVPSVMKRIEKLRKGKNG